MKESCRENIVQQTSPIPTDIQSSFGRLNTHLGCKSIDHRIDESFVFLNFLLKKSLKEKITLVQGHIKSIERVIRDNMIVSLL